MNQFLILFGALVVAALVSSFVSLQITGMATNAVTTYPAPVVRANSCDADPVCEVNNKILSPNTLTMSATSGAARIEGDLTLTKIGQTVGTLFQTNSQGNLTITPQNNVVDIRSQFFEIGSQLYLRSLMDTSKWAKIEVNYPGDANISSKSGFTNVQDLRIKGLQSPHAAPTESWFVCVRYDGTVYKSTTPCR